MSTTNTSIRLKSEQHRALITRQRGPCLVAAFALAVTLYATDGGGDPFYDQAYNCFTNVEASLIGSPEAPLSFLNSDLSLIDRLQLHGIVYSTSSPIAVINERHCAPGDKIQVKIGRHQEVIECLEIEEDSVQIQTSLGLTNSLRLQ